MASIVGGVTSLVLNASLGSSGGSSQGSADLSGGASSASSSSHGTPHTDQHHHWNWIVRIDFVRNCAFILYLFKKNNKQTNKRKVAVLRYVFVSKIFTNLI